jgi:hypothetical protein
MRSLKVPMLIAGDRDIEERRCAREGEDLGALGRVIERGRRRSREVAQGLPPE